MKLTGADSAGQLTVYESFYPPRIGHPLHIHHDAIESFYMLEGSCRFIVGADTFTASESSFLSVPRGATHGLIPIGGPGRALVFFTPAAMEGYWEGIAAATAAGRLDEERLNELGRQHHVETVGTMARQASDPMHAGRALFVGPRESRAGDVVAAGTDTSGAFGLVETTIPRGHSAPLHVHRHEDEAFYVLDGTVDFVCGDERFRAEQGAIVCLPRGVPHSFLGVSDQAARVLVLMLPAGLEAAFADPERFDEVFRRRHVKVVGPPLTL
jgi:quercetin dioxygenase-like cupin family protein